MLVGCSESCTPLKSNFSKLWERPRCEGTADDVTATAATTATATDNLRTAELEGPYESWRPTSVMEAK